MEIISDGSGLPEPENPTRTRGILPNPKLPEPEAFQNLTSPKLPEPELFKISKTRSYPNPKLKPEGTRQA